MYFINFFLILKIFIFLFSLNAVQNSFLIEGEQNSFPTTKTPFPQKVLHQPPTNILILVMQGDNRCIQLAKKEATAIKEVLKNLGHKVEFGFYMDYSGHTNDQTKRAIFQTIQGSFSHQGPDLIINNLFTNYLNNQFSPDDHIFFFESTGMVGFPAFWGRDPAVNVLLQNKQKLNELAFSAGLTVPNTVYIDSKDYGNLLTNPMRVSFPHIVKANSAASSFFVFFVEDENKAQEIQKVEFPMGITLVQDYIKGIELQVGLLAGKAFVVVAPEFKGPIFSYEAKYEEKISRAVAYKKIPDSIYIKVLENAEIMYKKVGLTYEIARCDYIYSLLDGKLYFLEFECPTAMGSEASVEKSIKAWGWSSADIYQYLIHASITSKSLEKKG